MPELPEVETIKRTLATQVIGKEISDVQVLLPRIIRQPSIAEFCNHLSSLVVTDIKRRGKFLQFVCPPFVLISHLRMEGKYSITEQSTPVGKHTHVRFLFTDGQELRYNDVRQFGTMDLLSLSEADQLRPLADLGPEPLTDQFTLSWFQEMLSKRKTVIKNLLLNQTILAGLGNIYVDEALHQAGVHPLQRADQIPEAKQAALFTAINQIIKAAIDRGGSSVRSYIDSTGQSGSFQQELQVYGRKNKPCNHCETNIERSVVAGRGTHICPCCQVLI